VQKEHAQEYLVGESILQVVSAIADKQPLGVLMPQHRRAQARQAPGLLARCDALINVCKSSLASLTDPQLREAVESLKRRFDAVAQKISAAAY
jgi:hypothetical protein